MSSLTRTESFGQGYQLTWIDRFGVWLSARQVNRSAKIDKETSVIDVGCGFDARLGRSLAPRARQMTLVDVALNPDLENLPNVRCVQGRLPHCLSDIESRSQDLVLCLSVLEHVWEPEKMLGEFERVLRPGGRCLINVPSWLGKSFLEFSAFRLGLSPASEMEDHKMYYNPRDLWPLLVRAGFAPSRIEIFRHKFGLNTFAAVTQGGKRER